jgi:hypothetical protein
MRDRDAPFQIPGYAARFQPFLQPSICDTNCVLAPCSSYRGLTDVLLQFLPQQGKLQEQVIRITDTRCAITNLKNGPNRSHKRNEIWVYLVRTVEYVELEKLLHALHLGSISSVELSNLPHLSHWSPLAELLSHPSTGQEPTTNLSAKNLWHDSQ